MVTDSAESGEGYLPPLGRHFPLCPTVELDRWYMNLSWPIGLREDYPAELKRRVVGAAVSYHAGLSSVDYTIKKYGPKEEKAESRLDLEVSSLLESAYQFITDVNHEMSFHDDSNVGRLLFEFVYYRQQFCFQQSLTLANRGAKLECLSVLRMQLEQLAWAASVDFVDDSEKIKRMKAQSAVSALKKNIPEAGYLYGYLSKFAHWDYDAQRDSMIFDGERMGILHASVAFKAELYEKMLSLFILAAKTFAVHRNKQLRLLDREDRPEVRIGEMINQADAFRETIVRLQLKEGGK